MIWLKLRRTCCDEGELVRVNLSWGKNLQIQKKYMYALTFWTSRDSLCS